jgi:hypothetical protein
MTGKTVTVISFAANPKVIRRIHQAPISACRGRFILGLFVGSAIPDNLHRTSLERVSDTLARISVLLARGTITDFLEAKVFIFPVSLNCCCAIDCANEIEKYISMTPNNRVLSFENRVAGKYQDITFCLNVLRQV